MSAVQNLFLTLAQSLLQRVYDTGGERARMGKNDERPKMGNNVLLLIWVIDSVACGQ